MQKIWQISFIMTFSFANNTFDKTASYKDYNVID